MPRLVSLGRWRWPAVSLCASAVFLGLAMPMGVLCYWVVRGLAAGETLDPVWEITANSAYVSGVAAVVAVGVSLPVAVLGGAPSGALVGAAGALLLHGVRPARDRGGALAGLLRAGGWRLRCTRRWGC